MLTNLKRMKYESEDEYFSSGAEVSDAEIDSHKRKSPKSTNGKWLSRNAIMARENRLKKKAYVSNLEKEVGKLKIDNVKYNKIIENQSELIKELKMEVKYLKSVIANSADLNNLLRHIQNNTGMSATTSLDKSLSMNNDYVSKPKQPIARKTAHPWEESYSSLLSPESQNSPVNDFNPELFNEFDDFWTQTTLPDLKIERNDLLTESLLNEHDYTTLGDINDDVGVCLHVSKHRVSLEFCSKCSENADSAWRA